MDAPRYAPGDRVRHGHAIDPHYEIAKVVTPLDDDPSHVWLVFDLYPNDSPAWTTPECLRPLERMLP